MTKKDFFLQNIFIFFISVSLVCCKKKHAPDPVLETKVFTTLYANHFTRDYGHPTMYDSLFYGFFKTQSEFDDYFSKPLNLKSKKRGTTPWILFDQTLVNDKSLFIHILRYDSIPPGTYYLKIFNAHNLGKFVEFNKPTTFTISNQPDSIVVFNTVVERYVISSFLINEMEIHLDKSVSYIPRTKLKVKFYKQYPPDYAGQPKTFYEDSVFVEDFPYRKKQLAIKINEFNSTWYDPDFYIEISGRGSYKRLDVNIFNLLNLNKRFSDSLIFFDSKRNTHYKLYGKWNPK